jgi:hypothetical protein
MSGVIASILVLFYAVTLMIGVYSVVLAIT